MIFINDRKLARRFHDNAVSSSQQFWYLLISLGRMVLYQCSFVPRPTALAPWNLYNDILTLSFFLIATSWCYHINKSGDHKEFMARYIALGVPIGIQIGFLSVAVGFGAGFLMETFPALLGNPVPDEATIKATMGLSLGILARLYFLWRLTSAFKIASGKDKKKAAPAKKR